MSSLKLIREAILQSKYSTTKKKTLHTLQEAVGKAAALRIVEAYTVTPDDYNKWLDVIEGFARENAINIRTKTAFEDVAFAVLENDPAPIDETMKEAIVDTLWQHQKVKKTHSKVEKAARAKEEEEQLKYAINRMKGGYQDEEHTSAFSQAYNDAVEDEEDLDFDIDSPEDKYNRYNRQISRFKKHGDDYNFTTHGEHNAPRYNDDLSGIDIADDEDYRSIGMHGFDEFEDEEDFGLPFADETEWDEDAGVSFTRDRYGNKVFDDEPWYKEDRENWYKQNRSHEDEDEEDFDPDSEFDPRDFEDDLGDRDAGWNKRSGPLPPDEDEDDWGEEYLPPDEDGDESEFGDDESDFDDFEDPRDADIRRRGSEMKKDRDLEDWDLSSDEGMNRLAREEQIMKRGRDIEKTNRFNEMEPRSKPRAFYAAEQEEMNGKDYNSPFSSGQHVIHKKTKATYVVEIPDGPGDQVGVKINGRLTMVPSKDLEAIDQRDKEEEESTSKPSSNGKVSYLHDVLTGSNSQNNLKKLQQEIETQAANAWTEHHAKIPKNPHEKGSIAYKAWEKGMAAAAKAVWAPKPVIDPKIKQKQKPKAKKR